MREDEDEVCCDIDNVEGVLEIMIAAQHEFNFLPLIWRDRPQHRRHANACLLVARQLAFAAAGPAHAAYFKRHRAKLMTEASELISSRAGLAKWRLHRR